MKIKDFIKDFINKWKHVLYALALAVASFLTVTEIIKWIFFFWFDDESVGKMMEHGFYWGGGFAVVVFVMYLFSAYQAHKTDEVD